MKQKHRSNSYMDNASETIPPICKYLQSIMTVFNIGPEEQQEVSVVYHKANGAKYWLNPYVDDATEMILPICKCLLYQNCK